MQEKLIIRRLSIDPHSTKLINGKLKDLAGSETSHGKQLPHFSVKNLLS